MDVTMNKVHLKWMEVWGHIQRARCLLIFHGDNTLVSFNGVGFQKWCKMIRGRGYDIRTWYINAVECGSAIWSNYTVSFCFPADTPLIVPNQLSFNKESNPRPCRNVMKLYGIPKHKYHKSVNIISYTHPKFKNVMGKFKGQLVYHWDGPTGKDIIYE